MPRLVFTSLVHVINSVAIEEIVAEITIYQIYIVARRHHYTVIRIGYHVNRVRS